MPVMFSRVFFLLMLTANIGLYSSYRFRGIDQTFGKPALQGGFDYAHASGFYAGNWNSNVNAGAGYPSGNLEMDFYGGWKKTWGDWGLDVGAIYYYYPGSNASLANGTALTNARTTSVHTGRVDNTEVYIGGSWKFVMHGPGGKDYRNESQFVEIVLNALVRIRHVSHPHYTLSIALTASAKGTVVSWEQDFDDPKAAAGLRHIVEPANEQNLDRLTAEVAAAGESPGSPPPRG